MTADHELDRTLEAWLAEPGPRLGPDVVAGALTRVGTTRQRRASVRTLWGRLGLLRGRPLLVAASTLSIGVVGLVIAAGLAATFAPQEGTRVGPDGGRVLVVAVDGSGDHATIAEAVVAAEDGDTVLIRPGTYTETLVIDADITLRGEEGADKTIIVAPSEPATTSTGRMLGDLFGSEVHPYAILLDETNATIEGITLRGSGTNLIVDGGSPTIERVVFDGVRPLDPFRRGGHGAEFALVVRGGDATVRDSLFFEGAGIGVFDLADVQILDNTLIDDGARIMGGFGDGAIVRGNLISGSRRPIDGFSPSAILVLDVATPTIEDNTIIATDDTGIEVGNYREQSGVDPIVRGNHVTGGAVGIHVGRGARPIVEANEITDTTVGIELFATDAAITANIIEGGDAGIVVSGGAPHLEGNRVNGNALGITIVPGVAGVPTLIGNDICGNDVNLQVAPTGVEPIIEDSRVCPDGDADPGSDGSDREDGS